MSPSDRMTSALNRIASATSIQRVRTCDLSRVERHGGGNGTLRARQEQVVVRLERIADDLERLLH